MANLFIAMGGSGLKTVREIRKKQREGDYFLFVDTDTNDLIGFSDREKVDLSSINVTSYLSAATTNNNPVRKKVDERLDPSARASMKNGPLKDGASANRPQGRLAIASIAEEFKNRIKQLVLSINDINKNDTDGLNTFIVLSVAGGTGSSIYLDLTQIIYDELYKLKQNDFKKPTAIFYMPDIFVQFQEGENVDRYKSNVFGFWKELDAIQRDYFGSIDMNLIGNDSLNANQRANRSTYFKDFAVIADKFTSDRVPFQAFQSAILIDHENSDGMSTDIKKRYKDVARLLEMISVRTYGGSIKSALDNSILPNAVYSLNNRLPWVKQYWSAGYAEIKGGSDLFQEYVKANIKRLVFETFVGINGATKEKLDESVKSLFQDHLLSYIERDTYNGYLNKAKEENDKSVNLHTIIDKYWAENINQNLERQYADGVEVKDDTSADGLLRLFDNDIKDKVSLKLLEFIKTSGYNIDTIANKIVDEFYQNCTEIALTDGLQRLGFVLEGLDTLIDDLSLVYDAELKTLSDKKTNIIVDNQEIVNRNLADTIIAQYAVVKEGPSALTFKKTQWYENELTNLKNLIRAYFTYQSEELALKLKKEICEKISLGKLGNMQARDNVSKLISTLQTKIDKEITPNAHKHLIQEYLSYKDNALTTIIPDVSRFSETDAFEDSKKNVFKRIFENECGLATGIKDGKSFFVTKKSQKTDDNTKTVEDLIRIVFNNSQYLITNLQSGTISDTKFVEELDKLIDENLISKLTTILTNGQSQNNEPTGYPKYVSYTLNKWIDEDSESFNSIKKKFDSRASVFCRLRNSSIPKQIWICPEPLKKRIDEIYSAEGNDNIPRYTHQETNEDAIISIKYVDNLSFDNYFKYDQYKDHYQICLSSNINNYYPHIDVRFKNAMANSLYDVENQSPILNVLAQGASQSNNTVDESNKGKNSAINYLQYYSKFYFLAKFYEKLNSESNKGIFKNLVMNDSVFIDKMNGQGRHDKYNPPVFFENGRIIFFSSSDINKLQERGIVWLSGNTVTLENFLEILTPEKLGNYLQSVILLSEEKPSEWSMLDTKTNIIQVNELCIKKRYATTQDKTTFKSILSETIGEVKQEIMRLSPSEEDYKQVFNDFYLSFSNDLNKLIN